MCAWFRMGVFMNTAMTLDSQVNQLVGLVEEENYFDMPFADVLPRQLAAIDERFQDRVHKIKLLMNRAETGGVKQVGKMADIVPLLFAHTAYKSYPESWLVEQKWDRLGRWLDTVSTNRVAAMNVEGVAGLDDWLARLGEQGHFVSCSSGTTGKCAMMNATQADLDFSGHALLRGLPFGGLKPNHDRRVIALGQVAASPRNRATGRPMMEALSAPGLAPFAPNVPPITVGSITEMVTLRKKLADGTAKPGEIARYEAEAAAREQAVKSAVQQAADALIENRHLKLHITAMPGPMYQVAELVRSRGYGAKDFNPENSAWVSGGLKRAVLPPDYLEIIIDTFNFSPDHFVQAYGMQEINTTAFRCKAGRYHMAPWVMLLLLDESGENLIEPTPGGELEGRAAFFDLSLDGRWGGVISGDKIRATWAPCACGNRSPSVAAEIQRYADLASGDKIACAGTIDAYVRGVT
jgi:hypothetical protein